MKQFNKSGNYKKYLEKKYLKLVEEVEEYRYIDEAKSDTAAFLAMKTLEKLNIYNYLSGGSSNFSIKSLK